MNSLAAAPAPAVRFSRPVEPGATRRERQVREVLSDRVVDPDDGRQRRGRGTTCRATERGTTSGLSRETAHASRTRSTTRRRESLAAALRVARETAHCSYARRSAGRSTRCAAACRRRRRTHVDVRIDEPADDVASEASVARAGSPSSVPSTPIRSVTRTCRRLPPPPNA